MASHLLDDDIPEVEVDVQQNRSYAENLAGIATSLVQGKKGVAKAFDLRLPVSDPNDIGKYSARLAPDGMSIRITLPTVPSYFYTSAEAMIDLEKEDCDIFFSETATMTQAFATKVRNNITLQTRSIQLNLSQKCRVFDERFGLVDGQSKVHGYELTAHEYVLPFDFEGVPWAVIYLFWRVQLDDSFEETSTPAQKNKRDDLKKKMERLTLNSKQKNQKPKQRNSNAGSRKSEKPDSDDEEGNFSDSSSGDGNMNTD